MPMLMCSQKTEWVEVKECKTTKKSNEEKKDK